MASDALRGRGSTGTGERRRSPPARDISQSVPGTVNGKWSHRDQLVVTTLGRNPYLPDCVDSAMSDDNAYPGRSAALRAAALGAEVMREGEALFDDLRRQWEQKLGKPELARLEEQLAMIVGDAPIRLLPASQYPAGAAAG